MKPVPPPPLPPSTRSTDKSTVGIYEAGGGPNPSLPQEREVDNGYKGTTALL